MTSLDTHNMWPQKYYNVMFHVWEEISCAFLQMMLFRNKTYLSYLLHIPRRDVLTGLFAVPWYAGEAALLASKYRKYMQNI